MHSLNKLRDRLRSLDAPRVAPKIVTVQDEARQQSTVLTRLQSLVGGEIIVKSGLGSCLVVQKHYNFESFHGKHSLGETLQCQSNTLALISGDERLSALKPEDAVYFDTETTGLAGGTGTTAFLVGIGRFTENGFTVWQYFLPSPTDELFFLLQLQQTLNIGKKCFLVSYNGKCFDAPLLQARFIMQRQRVSLLATPHLDLLYSSRRLYRQRLPDCSLSTVERQVLQVMREADDVPSSLIPALYFDYLTTGAVEPLQGVFYHNLLDILSLATLNAAIGATIEGRGASDPGDWIGAGRIWESAGVAAQAEDCYRRATVASSSEQRCLAFQQLGFLMKRSGRLSEAAIIWRGLVESELDCTGIAHIELAKYLEHTCRDYTAALHVTEIALRLPVFSPQAAQEELAHRLRRLKIRIDHQGVGGQEQ